MFHAVRTVLASRAATLLELPGPVGAYLNLERVSRGELRTVLVALLLSGEVEFNPHTQCYCLTEKGLRLWKEGE